jgi:ABC-type dipeptide/oligopeptide/nickel transport system permease subunit
VARTQSIAQPTGWLGARRRRWLTAFLLRMLGSRGAGFGLLVVAVVLLVALGADLIAPYDPDQRQEAGILAAPSPAHWLGTDQLARDVLSRIIYGARTSVQAGVVSVGFALVAGVCLGLLMLRHIWPNVTAPIIVQASLLVASAIVIEAALSFLGLGIEPPAPSWGSMLKGAYQYMQQALWLSVAPGVAIFVTVLAFNLLGDGLRGALDPRLWQRGER